jgi:hypothetical protein
MSSISLAQNTTYTTSSSDSLLSELEAALRRVEQELRAAEIAEATWGNFADYWRSRAQSSALASCLDEEDDG